MPVTSDTSVVTSVTASPLDNDDPEDNSIDFKAQISNPETLIRDERGGHNQQIEQSAERKHPSAPARSYQEVEGDGVSTGPMLVEATTTSSDARAKDSLNADYDKWNWLASLTKEEQHQKWRVQRLQREADHLQLSDGLNQRLQNTFSIAHGNLIDQFKGDDQAGFAGLFEASERLSRQYDSRGWNASSNGVEHLFEDVIDPMSSSQRPSALDRLDTGDQNAVLGFLDKLRTDLDYLAELISALPATELASLTSCYHPAGVDLSILSNHSHGRTQLYSRDSQMLKLSRRMDHLDLFHHKDPYYALRYCLFDSSANLSSRETSLRQEIWARTCAKVMSEGKPGSEEFAIATLDSFVPYPSFGLKEEFQSYLLEALAEGWFILDPPDEEVVEKAGHPMEPERAGHAIAVAEYLDRHTRKLFELLTTHLATILPRDVLAFIHATLSNIKEMQVRELAKKFIVSRWFVASFLTSVMVYPEVRGMCLTHHIGHSARQNILNRLAINLQSQVFSVLAPSSSMTFILPEVQDQVFQILDHFEPSPTSTSPHFADEDVTITNNRYLTMSPWDIIGLIEALHPTLLASQMDSPNTYSTPGESLADSSPANTQVVDQSHMSNMQEEESRAESLSTEGTYVGSDQPSKFGSDREHTVSLEEPSEPDGRKTDNGLQRLDIVSTRLKSLCKGLTRSTSMPPSDDWILFKVDPTNATLKLRQTSHERPGSVSDDRVQPGSMTELQEDAKFRLLRDAFKALLGHGLTYAADDIFASTLSRPQDLENVGGLLQSLVEGLKSKHRFLDATYWSQVHKAFDDLCQSYEPGKVVSTLVQDLVTWTQARRDELRAQSITYERIVGELDAKRRLSQRRLGALGDLRHDLRLKMWYASDVKLSGPYEDALRVIKALRSMASPKRTKQQGGFAGWAKQRLRGINAYDRADRQALEAVSASKDQGGSSKLGDDQIDLTNSWMAKNQVENFCKSEERLHRFYFEVQKLVKKLAGNSLMESPVLWSSHFFRREKTTFDAHSRQSSLSSLGSPMTPPYRYNETSSPRSPGRGYLPTFSTEPRLQPTLDVRNPLQLSNMTHIQPRSGPYIQSKVSAVLPGNGYGHLTPPMTPLSPRIMDGFGASTLQSVVPIPKAKTEFVEKLRDGLCGLINSDLGYMLWSLGSETDAWINRAVSEFDKEPTSSQQDGSSTIPTALARGGSQGPGGQDNRAEGKPANDEVTATTEPSTALQDSLFPEAYGTILHNFSWTQDPYEKLQWLAQLEELVIVSLQNGALGIHGHQHTRAEDKTSLLADKEDTAKSSRKHDQVYANCSQRRTCTFRAAPSRPPLPFATLTSPSSSIATATPNTNPDAVISKLLSLLRDPLLRPSTLFRDLQLISSTIPSSVLDHTPQGRAFWSLSLAALTLKDELIAHTISRATTITEYHLSLSTKHPPQLLDSSDEASRTEVPKWVRESTLKDAAELWLRAAKEGSPVAARELALFYLTHPDLIRRVTAPMAKGKDVFRGAANMAMNGGGGGLDPNTFCVVLHWMNVAAENGDAVATQFLKENGGGSEVGAGAGVPTGGNQ